MLIFSNTVLTEKGNSYSYTLYNTGDRYVVINTSMAMGATLVMYHGEELLIETNGNNKNVVLLPEGEIYLIVFSGVVATSTFTMRDLRWFDYLYNYWFRRKA